MKPEKELKKRREARGDVEKFFSGKREKASSLSDPQIRARFLAELNTVAMDAEHRAMGMASKGKGWDGALEKARREVEELKEDFIRRLGGDDPVFSAPNKGLIEEIKRI